MAAQRNASAVWQGDLLNGSGTVSAESSGAFSNLAVNWQARSGESANGTTSPEELIAAAHAACISMALAGRLAKAGHKPERIATDATATFEKVGDAFTLTTMTLNLRGTVPGIDNATFVANAEEASKNCPVSRALAGNVRIEIEAELE